MTDIEVPRDVEIYETTGPEAPTNRTPADAETIIRAIERPLEGDAERSAHTDWLPMMDLPGFGEEYDDCGDDYPHFCESCGDPTFFGRTCNRSQCPRCAMNWARKRASAVAGKLDALRRYLYASGPDNQFYHHLVISPPNDWALRAGDETLDVFERSLDVVKEVLDELGVQGTVFYHPWRGADGDDRGAWKHRMGKRRPWDSYQSGQPGFDGEPVRDELEFSPHFHIVGVAPFVDGGQVTKAVEAATGWIIHRITESENSTVSIRDDVALARVLTYCLSHTGLYEAPDGKTRAAYRYVGADCNAVTAYEDNQKRMDAIVRAVAPKTLGIPLAELACSTDVIERAEVRVDLGRAIGSTMIGTSPTGGDDLGPDGNVDATGELIVGSSGIGHDDGLEWLADEAGGVAITRDDPDRIRCEGRLLPIDRAEKFLEDPEWCEQAEHVDELRDVHREWKHDRDDIPLEDDPPPD